MTNRKDEKTNSSNKYKTEVKQFGDLKVGDKILGADGEPVTVTNVYDKHIPESMYELEMDDGEVVQASGDHLWYCESEIDEKNKEEYLRLAIKYFNNHKLPDKLKNDVHYKIEDIIKVFEDKDKDLKDNISFIMFIEKVCKSLGHSSEKPYLTKDLSGKNTVIHVKKYSFNDLITFLRKAKQAADGDGYFYFGQVRTTEEIANIMSYGKYVNIPHREEIENINN